jgi:hypothetical protein
MAASNRGQRPGEGMRPLSKSNAAGDEPAIRPSTRHKSASVIFICSSECGFSRERKELTITFW